MTQFEWQRPSGSILQPASSWLIVVGSGLQIPLGPILQPTLVKMPLMAAQVWLRIAGRAVSTLFSETTLFSREVAAEAFQGVVKSTVRARETVMRRSVRMGGLLQRPLHRDLYGRAGGSTAKVH
jgi:hypothetical protein